MSTYADILANVRAAMNDVMATGQSVRFKDRLLTKANLKELSDLESKYSSLAAAEARAAAGKSRNRTFYISPQ